MMRSLRHSFWCKFSATCRKMRKRHSFILLTPYIITIQTKNFPMFTNQLYTFIVRLKLLSSRRLNLVVDTISYTFGFKPVNSVLQSTLNSTLKLGTIVFVTGTKQKKTRLIILRRSMDFEQNLGGCRYHYTMGDKWSLDACLDKYI